MLSKLIIPEISELIDKKDFTSLREVVENLQLPDVADLLNDLDENRQAIFLRILPKNISTDIFEHLEPEIQIRIIEKFSANEIASILNEMSPDDRTNLLEEMPAPIARKMIGLLSKDKREIALAILAYPENSIGRLITTEFISVNPNMTVKQAFDHIRKYGKNSETVNVIYIVDDNEKLIDDLKIRELIFADENSKILDLMDSNFVSLIATDDQENAIEIFKKYDRIALPVTDNSGVLLGIVTIDDIIDVAEEEATEDIHKFGGSGSLEESYADVNITTMIRKRAFWLSLLFVGEMFTATAMAYFEVEISKAVVLALFIPLIISSGGNSGSQAATLVIRALALQEVSIKDWFKILKREFFSGFALGAILATIGFLRILLGHFTSDIYGVHWNLIAAKVSLSLIGVVTWGTLVGGLFPLILKKFGLDPATSSAPFVATLVDVFGIVIYFSIALLHLSGVML